MAVGIDTTNPAGLPPGLNPAYVLGYTNGIWPDWKQMSDRYPSAICVRLSAVVDGQTTIPHGWDGEKGDYGPQQAAQFSKAKIASGFRPFGYCSFAAWPDYKAAHVAIGIDPSLVDWAIAAYPGIGPILYPGSPWHQWIDRGTYDQSVVQDGWQPGAPIHPPANPQPVPELSGKDAEMSITSVNGILYIERAGAGTSQDHQLLFIGDPAGWKCIDITDAVGAANPGIPPYLVQP